MTILTRRRGNETGEARATQPPERRRLSPRLTKGVVPYEPSDRAELHAFLAKMFGPDSREAHDERFDWLYERNPFRVPGAPRITLVKRDGQIVGHQGAIHYELSIDGERYPVPWGIDLIVEPKLQRKGAGAALLAVTMEPYELIGTLNLSEAGAAATTSFGFEHVATVPVYVRPLDAVDLAAETGAADRLTRFAPLAQPLIGVGNLAVRALARLARLELEPVDRFDGRSDEVWEAASPDYPVLAVRDLAANTWRIDERPNRDEMQRFYLRRGKKTLGYVVLRKTRSANATMVVDYLAPARWVAPMLSLAAIEAKSTGSTALMCKTHNSPADRSLRASGFIRRASVGEPPILLHFVSFENELLPRVYDGDNWFLTAADGDLEPGVPHVEGDRADS